MSDLQAGLAAARSKAWFDAASPEVARAHLDRIARRREAHERRQALRDSARDGEFVRGLPRRVLARVKLLPKDASRIRESGRRLPRAPGQLPLIDLHPWRRRDFGRRVDEFGGPCPVEVRVVPSRKRRKAVDS